jgi:hypothetical protein
MGARGTVYRDGDDESSVAGKSEKEQQIFNTGARRAQGKATDIVEVESLAVESGSFISEIGI